MTTKTIRVPVTIYTGNPTRGPAGTVGLVEVAAWNDAVLSEAEADRILTRFGGQEKTASGWVDVDPTTDGTTLATPSLGRPIAA